MERISLDSLPVGLRFRPTDEELIRFYLRSKINGKTDDIRVISEVDICKWEPWDLPELSAIRGKDVEWLFFCPLDRKSPNGSRMNRATVAGYWKATGKDRKIKCGKNFIGVKRTLVFYTGRAPKGNRTGWVMHEYRATEKDLSGMNPGQSPFVICKLFKKQEDTIEVSKSDEVEPPASSPSVAKSSPREIKFELEPSNAPVTLKLRGDMHSLDVKPSLSSCSGAGSDTLAGTCPVPEAEVTNADVDQQQDLYFLDDPLFECNSLDFKPFSPLPFEWQAEVGSSCLLYPDASYLYNKHGDLQAKNGAKDSDDYISRFLDSILQNPAEYSCETEFPPKIKECGFQTEVCSMLDVEQAQGQVDMEFSDPLWYETNCKVNGIATRITTGDYSTEFGCLPNQIPTLQNPATGITIRSRQEQTRPFSEDIAIQGDASRRVLLQTRLSGSQLELERHEVKPSVLKVESATKETSGEYDHTRSIRKRVVSTTARPFTAVLRASVVAVIFLISICSLHIA